MGFRIAQFQEHKSFDTAEGRPVGELDDALQMQVLTDANGIWLRAGPDGTYEKGVVLALGCDHLRHTYTQVATPGGLRELVSALTFIADKLEGKE